MHSLGLLHGACDEFYHLWDRTKLLHKLFVYSA
jgi:hypothetical protein